MEAEPHPSRLRRLLRRLGGVEDARRRAGRSRPHRRWHPNALGVAGMLGVLVLASGITNVDRASPAEQYVDDQIRAQLIADQRLEPITDGPGAPPGGAIPPDLSAPRTSLKPDKKPFVRDYRKIAREIAVEEGIRVPELFVRQMAAESGMQPCVRSGAGAIGIAQIMPDTARSWKVDPYLPEHALRAAAKAMARYHKQYGDWRLALAAYNAGPGAVQGYGGVPPYAETQEYIRRVMDRSYPLRGMQQVFNLPKGHSTRFNQGLKDLRAAVARQGGKVTVVSGHRTYYEQLQLWTEAKRKYGGWWNATRWVAPPGCSNHNRGWAADLAGDLELAHRLAPRFGLTFPMAHEPWHVELAGISTQSG